jgi:dienelactone hydrolase
VSQREDIHIPSDGEQLAAYVYRPDSANRDVPCVVMAHGFSGTRDDGLPAYAEAFRAAGYAVVLFDFRHFGASSGQPRQLLDIERQIADYRAVVQWARQLDGVDPDRIVLWGTSFSGGHVLEVAATDARIAAVIAQVPFADGIPMLMGGTADFPQYAHPGVRHHTTPVRADGQPRSCCATLHLESAFPFGIVDR